MFKDDNGKVSLLRVIAFMGSICGVGVCGASVVGMFLNLGSAMAALGIGAGMLATAQGFKAWQKKNEAK